LVGTTGLSAMAIFRLITSFLRLKDAAKQTQQSGSANRDAMFR
jgi:hypothetical protein